MHFTSTIVDVVPRIYRELDRALHEAFPEAGIEAPPLLRFGSWIGGDRDGNPYVTPQTTLQTLTMLRDHCLRFLIGRLEALAGRLSFSERLAPPGTSLDAILEFGEQRFPELAATLHKLNPEEPYRRALSYMRERLRATAAVSSPTATEVPSRADPAAYDDPSQLLADLRTIEQALRADAGGFSAAGDLRDVIRQVEVFGFHFATVDIRQHVKAHRAALAEVSERSGSQTATRRWPRMIAPSCWPTTSASAGR